jgi:hypothetical protein
MPAKSANTAMEPKSRILRLFGKRNNTLPILDFPATNAWGRKVLEATMTHAETKALADASRASMAWSIEGYDGQTHYGDVLKALAPAFLILAAAAGLLVAVL